jgi:hypothetical protein
MGIAETWEVRWHLEAHAVAQMRVNGISDAVLYLNNRPCSGRFGCQRNLPVMLAPGTTLTVFGPDGYCRVYNGMSEEER